MDLYLLHNSPNNAVLARADGTPVYHVATPGIVKRHAIVRKAQPNIKLEEAPILARMDWKVIAKSTVSFGGQTMAINEYLPRSTGWYSHSRSFVAGGATYTWKIRKGKCTLLNPSSTTIAKFHCQHFGILSPKRNAYLSLGHECIPMLDQVVVSFLIMDRKKREKEAATASGG